MYEYESPPVSIVLRRSGRDVFVPVRGGRGERRGQHVQDFQRDQEYVRFRGTLQFDTELTCHETGHAVGLTHGANASPAESNTAAELGCMETPDSASRPGLGSHNQSEINSTY